MDLQELFSQAWQNLGDRPSGPLSFRFILQPLMALALGTRDGIRDARSARTPYLWSLVREPGQRAQRLGEGLRATSRVLILGVLMDTVYQLIVLKTLHVLGAVLIALLLGFLPYLLVRGPVARIARRHRSQRPSHPGGIR